MNTATVWDRPIRYEEGNACGKSREGKRWVRGREQGWVVGEGRSQRLLGNAKWEGAAVQIIQQPPGSHVPEGRCQCIDGRAQRKAWPRQKIKSQLGRADVRASLPTVLSIVLLLLSVVNGHEKTGTSRRVRIQPALVFDRRCKLAAYSYLIIIVILCILCPPSPYE